MKPLRLFLNKNIDKCMIEEFLNVSGGGVDFGRGIIKLHPKLKAIQSTTDKLRARSLICDYVDAYYQDNRLAMQGKIVEARSVWRERERNFVEKTMEFFDGFPFPDGKYIAYASIIDCNPRFLDSKTFQFFYKKETEDIVHVIAHELLHFIFFSYAKQNFQKEISILSEDQLWDFSEIFNIILLQSERYHQIVRKDFVLSYPDHRGHIRRFREIYRNSRNAGEFFKQGIDMVAKK